MAPKRNKPGTGTGDPPSGAARPQADRRAVGRRPLLAVLRALRHWNLTLMLFAALQLTAAPAFAQISREYQLKAVFLWRLAQFAQWPGEAFDSSDNPIVIGVLGENPFGDALEAAVRGETAHGRKLVVRYFRSTQEIKTCHILYMGPSVARQIKDVNASLRGRSILTVSDVEGFARTYDGMVQFLTEQNKIRLRVNVKAVAAAGLVLDPRLLRAAEIVKDE
jgi:hypothetical protein